MPYDSTENLPVNIKQKYSDKAQKAFMLAFNNVFKQTKDESRAFAAAHSAARKVDNLQEAVFRESKWTTAYINDLPDSSFAYVEAGDKDEDGKTTPRSKRHFPYKDADGSIDLPHLRNALARAPQSPFGDKAMPKLRAAAKSAGVGDYAENVTRKGEEAEASYWLDASFLEAPAYDESRGVYTVPVRLIRPGWSKNNFYYREGVLAQIPELMEGQRAYIDHETKSEIKERGSRTIDDMAGWYEGVYQESDGSIHAVLNMVETPRTEHAIKLAQANPNLVQLSINAKGKAVRGVVDNRKGMIAESFDKFYSTDLVCEAAAGGEITRMVASVTMDMEEDEELEDTNMAEEDKDMAAWLVAEMKYKMDDMKYKADYATWLAAEREHKMSTMEESIKEEKREKVLEEVPEHLREVLKDEEPEKIEKLLEAMKKAPAEKKNDTPSGDAEKPKPGEKGYKRNFL